MCDLANKRSYWNAKNLFEKLNEQLALNDLIYSVIQKKTFEFIP